MDETTFTFEKSQKLRNMERDGRWADIQNLLGGTEVMRAARTKYIARFDNEADNRYGERLERATLFALFEDTIEAVVDKPFSTDIAYTGDLSERLSRMISNADLNGVSMQDFAASVLRSAATYGHSHVITDYGNNFENRAAELDSHPFCRLVESVNVRQWDSHLVRGKEVITRFVYEEHRGDEVWIREWSPEVLNTYRPVPSKQTVSGQARIEEFILDSSVNHTYGEIPLDTYYTKRRGFMMSKPPFKAVAELNIEHFQKTAGLNNIIYYALVPMLFRAGWSDEELKKGFTLSAANAAGSTSPEAKLNWIELRGNQITIAQEDIKRLEERAEVLGHRVFVPRNRQHRTATGEKSDNFRGESKAQTWIRNLEALLMKLFERAAHWISEEIPEDFSIDIYSDFTVDLSASGDGKLIQDAAIAKLIDRDTYIAEMRRRGILSESVDPDEVALALLEETKTELLNFINSEKDAPSSQVEADS